MRGPILAAIPAEKPPDAAVFPQFARIHPKRRRGPGDAPVLAGGDNIPVDADEGTVNLARVAWLTTVGACVVAVVILVLDGYYGYAGVTLAVAISAGINLL